MSVMRGQHVGFVVVLLTIALIRPVGSWAQTVTDPVGVGTAWLLSARYGGQIWEFAEPPASLDAEFTAADLSRTSIRDTLTALNAIQVLPVATAEYNAALDWLDRSTFLSTDHLSEKTKILFKAQRDATQPLNGLLSAVNSDGGFGGLVGYPSDVPDTAQALLALLAA